MKKFYEVPVGTNFTLQGEDNNVVYQKIKEKRITCCKVDYNAKELASGNTVVFKPMRKVIPQNAD